MLLFQLASFLLVAGTWIFVAAGDKPDFAPPEILLPGGNPNTTFKPQTVNPVRRGNDIHGPKVIRGLLTWVVKRQSCSNGYGVCPNDEGT